MSRRRLYTTFPRRLIEDESFIRLKPRCQHLLYHLYAHLHPHGRANCSPLMFSRHLVPQLFPKWENYFDDLSEAGFIIVYREGSEVFVALTCYDDDQPANLLRDRPHCTIPYPEANTVLKLGKDCEDTVTTNQTNQTNQSKNKYTSSFERWYGLYPRKDGPAGPWKSWRSAVSAGADPPAIVAGLEAAIAANAFSMERKFQPMATTWLNQERWKADYSTPQSEMEGADMASLKRMQGETA